MNADNIKFRASAVSLIMKNDRSGKEMGETAKSYCKQLYREIVWGRSKDITTKQMERGKESEERGITLHSLETKTFYKKNEERIEDSFFTGHPDIFDGKDIKNVERGADIKCPWDLFTFPFPSDKLDDTYYYQNMTYMALTGAKQWDTVYTLVNLSAQQLDDEKRKAMYKIGSIDPDNDPVVKEKYKEIERNFIYDLPQFIKDYPWYDLANDPNEWKWDIPRSKRMIVFPVMRDESVIKAMQIRVLECRNWLNSNLFNTK